MNKQQRQVRAAVVGAVYYSFVIAVLAAAVLATGGGCMVQPVDSGTGRNIGEPVSALHAAPTTSPSGSPVVLQKTDDVDAEAVQQGVQTAAGFLPAPWNYVVAVGGSAAAGAFLATRKKKQQPQ